jgi:glycosyltransferase involved in cell wall biosynthesis
MRILMLCYEFPPIGGGGGRVAYGLSRELVRMGHKVDLLSMGHRRLPRRELVDGVHIIRIPSIRNSLYFCTIPEAASYMLSSTLARSWLARSKQYDLIHAHFIFPDGLLAWQIHKITSLPYLITAHGSDVPGYNPNRLKIAHRLLGPIWAIVTKNASKIICPSRILGDLILKRNKDINLEIIPNGIETRKFSPNREKRNRILIVSRMLKRKGIQFFLEAIASIGSDWEVHIVGNGPYLQKLREKSSGLKWKIKFWGWLDNESPELKELFETSSVFVLPSEAENFPIVLLEAMAAGMAILTTEGTGCAEVVGNAAMLVPPKNSLEIRKALSLILQCPDRRKKMGIAARKRIEEYFSWPAVCGRYLKLYDDTLVEMNSKRYIRNNCR